MNCPSFIVVCVKFKALAFMHKKPFLHKDTSALHAELVTSGLSSVQEESKFEEGDGKVLIKHGSAYVQFWKSGAKTAGCSVNTPAKSQVSVCVPDDMPRTHATAKERAQQTTSVLVWTVATRKALSGDFAWGAKAI